MNLRAKSIAVSDELESRPLQVGMIVALILAILELRLVSVKTCGIGLWYLALASRSDRSDGATVETATSCP